MARQPEGMLLALTIGNICFYVAEGKGYIREKSSLTGERVMNDDAFAATRAYASKMAMASGIGSFIYKAMPIDVKARWIYRAITGEAASLLYKGMEAEEVLNILWAKYIQDTGCENKEALKAKAVNIVPSTKENLSKLRILFYERWTRQGKPASRFRQIWKRQASDPSTFLRELERSVYGYPVNLV